MMGFFESLFGDPQFQQHVDQQYAQMDPQMMSSCGSGQVADCWTPFRSVRAVDWISNSDTVMSGIAPPHRCEYCRGTFVEGKDKCQNCGAPR